VSLEKKKNTETVCSADSTTATCMALHAAFRPMRNKLHNIG